LPDLSVAEFAPEDVAELLVLQRCCWVQEAIANDTLDVPALHESADEILAWASAWKVLCVRRGGRLVAAVRAREVEGVWELGRLMVAPDLSGRGIGRWLLQRAEELAPHGITGFALFTGGRSARNISLYRRAGYEIREASGGVNGHIAGAVFLTKSLNPDAVRPGP
jgi:GNAT superfamily N-acetyltransferase